VRLAITGATGFVGARLLTLALGAGHRITALTRRPQSSREGVEWIEGALDAPAALDRLVTGADAVIHVAGVVNVPDRAAFARGNIEGTRAVVEAARRAGPARFVHVSSLAAREPQLSDYGWSKAGAEAVVSTSPLDWDIVRPPAIYGPGDREMLDLFKAARWGVVPVPPAGRMSAIHVDDLAHLFLALAAAPATRTLYEVDDGIAGGWTHKEFARAIGAAVGRRVAPLELPRRILDLAARADALLRRDGAKLTPDRVSYFCHPDWTAAPDRRPPAALWTPTIATAEGLADTAAWYRAQGLL
jgi:nucleoside-diphosphate-sugar epimerase